MTSTRLAGIRAITLDFGNTLVRVRRADLQRVVATAAAEVVPRLGLGDVEAFRRAWAEERERQFREELPRHREVDLFERGVRVLARLRGMAAPAPEAPWDDAAAAGHSDTAEVEAIVDAYSRAFLAVMPPVDGVEPILEELSRRGFRVGVLSNWPLALTVDRYLQARGWDRYLDPVVVSQRVGTIKPHPRIFEIAADLIGSEPDTILHVGDDWAADVVGARGAGWRVAYLRDHQADTPLPTSARADDLVPDLELGALAELPARLEDPIP